MADDPWRDFRTQPDESATPGGAEDIWSKYRTAPVTVRVGNVPLGTTTAGNYFQTIDDAVRAGANAATFGNADRLAGWADYYTGRTKAPSAGEAVDEQAQKSVIAEGRSPVASFTGAVAGGMMPAIKMGQLARAALPAFYSTGPRAALSSIIGEGGTVGALTGAGQTYTENPVDYLVNAAKGGGIGMAGGAVGQVIGQGGKAAFTKIADKLASAPTPLIEAARTNTQGLRDLANRPGSMMPDAGPAMQGVAQGAVLGNAGPGSDALRTALTARDVASPTRITAAAERFGPAPVPSVVEEGVRGRMQAMSPEYQRVLNNARAVDTNPMALWLEGQIGNTRGEAQAALRQVRGMLDIPTNPGVLDPHPRALQATREAVRAMRDDIKLDDNTRRLMGLAERQLTNELQTKVPGIRQLDSMYAELGAQERAIQHTSAGARIFDTGRAGAIRPAEMVDVVREAVQPKGVNVGPSAEPFRLREAARAELDRIVGTKKNDLLALENVLGQPQDWNAQKLGIMFGPERANEMMRVLRDERAFRDTFQKVVEGSQTAQRTASKEALEAVKTPDLGKQTAFGTLLQGGNWLKDKVFETTSKASRDRIASILATTNPQEIQRISEGLIATAGANTRRAEIVRRLLEGTGIAGSSGVIEKQLR